MIKEKRGLLVQVKKENKVVSYSFFFKNNSEAFTLVLALIEAYLKSTIILHINL